MASELSFAQNLAFINAKIFDGEKVLVADALLIKDGRFIKIDKSETIKPLVLAKNIVDLKGQFVMPGFIDAHAHMVSLGKSLCVLDLRGKTLKEILDLVKNQATKQLVNTWIMGRGWDQNLWANKEFPSAKMLDELGIKNPVFLQRVDGHAAWINSKALSLANISHKTKSPDGGKIIVDDKQYPTGILLDTAIDMVKKVMNDPDEKTLTKYIERALKKVASLGITSFHDAGASKKELELFNKLATKKKLTTRVYAMIDGNDKELVNTYLKNGPINIDEMLSIRSIKYFADGALGSRGALLLDDYADEKGNKGLGLISLDELVTNTKKALESGFQVGTHAIGDGANRLVLDAYEKALEDCKNIKNPRLRIEHAQIIHPLDQPRFAQLNVIASMQPIHCTSDMSWVSSRIGKDFAQKAYPWQSLLKKNVSLAFGSDAPVEDINPILGIFAAITRQKSNFINDDIFMPNERLTMQQALHAYYQGGAYAEYNEHQKGKIALEFLADFIVFKEDIFSLTKKNFVKTTPTMTIVGGKVVYTKSE